MRLSLSPLREELIIDAPALIEYLEFYFDEVGKSVEGSTLRNYRFGLKNLAEFWRDKPELHNYQLSEATFSDFLGWMQDEKQSTEYTIYKSTKCTRTFLTWLYRRGAIPVDASELCPLIPPPRPQKFWPTVQQLDAVFGNMSGKNRVRNMALFAFLSDTGARIKEALHAERGNIYFNSSMNDLTLGSDHAGYVYLEWTKANKRRKRIPRYSLFGSECGLLLKCWMRISDGEKLFPVAYEGARKAFNAARDTAGISQFHIHSIRSAYIDYWSETHLHGGLASDTARS
jgi:integrase